MIPDAIVLLASVACITSTHMCAVCSRQTHGGLSVRPSTTMAETKR